MATKIVRAEISINIQETIAKRTPGWIVLIALVAFFWGYLPAIIIHDYGGTVITLVWLFLFGHFSASPVLKRIEEVAEAEG